MDVRRVIGTNIRRRRLALDLSQEVLAERMGVDRAYVSGMELGGRNPTAITLWLTAEALGIRPYQLLEEIDGEPMTPPPVRQRASKKLR